MTGLSMTILLAIGLPSGVESESIDHRTVLHEHYSQWKRQLRSLRYAGTAETESDPPRPRYDQNVRRVSTVRWPRRYLEAQHLSPPFDWNEDLAWSQVLIEPDRLSVYWVVNRLLELSPDATVQDNPKLGDHLTDVYWEAIGWFPVPETEDGDWLSPALASPESVVTLLDRDYYELRHAHDGQVSVAEIDCREGFAVVRRTLSSQDTGRRIAEWRNSEFTRCDAGLRLPAKLERTVYAPEPDVEAVFMTLHIDTLEANQSFNELESRLTRPGTIVRDQATRGIEVTGGGIELFETTCAIGERLINIERATAQAAGWSGWGTCFAGAFVLVFGILVRLAPRRIAPT